MKTNLFKKILLGTALIGTNACAMIIGTEPHYEKVDCDTGCTLSLEAFNGIKLPTHIYQRDLSVLADTIHIKGEGFTKKRVSTPLFFPGGIRVFFVELDSGKAIRTGTHIELLREYQRLNLEGQLVLDTDRIYGTMNDYGMAARQDSLFSTGGKLIYDGSGFFNYRFVR